MNRLLLMLLVVGCVCVGPLVATDPTPKLIRKWRQLFNYMNLVTTGSPQKLTIADYNEFKGRLENSAYSFSSIAEQVAGMYYPPQCATPPVSQTKAEYITFMSVLYSAGYLINPDNTKAMYDLLVGTQTGGAAPLQKATMVSFEAAIGQLNATLANAYLDLITSATTITKAQMVAAVVGYLSNPDTTLESMPLFGPYAGN